MQSGLSSPSKFVRQTMSGAIALPPDGAIITLATDA